MSRCETTETTSLENSMVCKFFTVFAASHCNFLVCLNQAFEINVYGSFSTAHMAASTAHMAASMKI